MHTNTKIHVYTHTHHYKPQLQGTNIASHSLMIQDLHGSTNFHKHTHKNSVIPSPQQGKIHFLLVYKYILNCYAKLLQRLSSKFEQDLHVSMILEVGRSYNMLCILNFHFQQKVFTYLENGGWDFNL